MATFADLRCEQRHLRAGQQAVLEPRPGEWGRTVEGFGRVRTDRLVPHGVAQHRAEHLPHVADGVAGQPRRDQLGRGEA